MRPAASWRSASRSSCSDQGWSRPERRASRVRRNASVGPSARARARDSTRSAKAASGTASQIRPQSAAARAVSGSPSSARPRARAGPSRRGSQKLRPASGIRPMREAVTANIAESAAMAMSAASASARPAPAAVPFTAARIGSGEVSIASSRGRVSSRWVRPRSRSAIRPASPRSWPAQNASPRPVSTSARPSAGARRSAWIRSAFIWASSAFSRSGRARATVTTPSRAA